jgi:4-amino-4-deoxy-L-arabinose transferase-like glycosyltransferase
MGAGHEVEIAPGPGSRAFAGAWWIVAVLVLATALRLGYLAELARTPWWTQLVVDPEYYDDWARRIAAGDWLGTRAFYMDPLYPYLLGAVYRLGGHDLWLARLLNVVCSVGACGATLLLARRIGGPLVGVLAGLGLALYEPDVFHVGEIDKTALSMLLVAIFLVLFVTGSKRVATRAAAGFALGLAVLTRANLLLFVPLGALLIAFDWTGGRRVAGACGFVLGAVAALAPVTWRNHHVAGEWVLTTTQLGQNFYTGNNPENPYGAYGVLSFVRANPHFEEEDFRGAAEARVGHPLRAGEVSWFWLRAGLDHIVTEPGFALRAFARKAALFWNDFELSDSADQYLAERDARVLRLPLLGFGEVAAFAVLGALVSVRRSGPVRLLVTYVVLYGATLVAFFLFARYRIQVVPALLPLAALGVVEAVRRLRARDPRRIAAAAAVVALSAAASFATIGIFSVDHPIVVEMRMRHLADAYMTAGDPERAIAALDEAVPGCTHGCPWALADLFAIYQRTGRFDEGVRYFERFVRAHPEQRDAPQYLADLRARVGPSPETR